MGAAYNALYYWWTRWQDRDGKETWTGTQQESLQSDEETGGGWRNKTSIHCGDCWPTGKNQNLYKRHSDSLLPERRQVQLRVHAERQTGDYAGT